MFRKINIVIFAAILLTAAYFAWAQDFSNIPEQVKNVKDYEAVRAVLYREIEGWIKKDPEQVLSCFDAENFVGYATGGSADPKEWTINAVGPADLRTYADRAKTTFQDIPAGYTHRAEIQHVVIKGDQAFAVARQWYHAPQEEKERTMDVEFESAWLLKRVRGQWKITGWISGVTSERKITEN